MRVSWTVLTESGAKAVSDNNQAIFDELKRVLNSANPSNILLGKILQTFLAIHVGMWHGCVLT